MILFLLLLVWVLGLAPAALIFYDRAALLQDWQDRVICFLLALLWPFWLLLWVLGKIVRS